MLYKYLGHRKLIFGLDSFRARIWVSGWCLFEELVLGHGLRGGWVACGLADLVSNGGGFSECFLSVLLPSWCLGCEKWRLSGGDQGSAAIIPVH
ncbi:hypothetical protein IGI04_037035 [Brassica rapa subsp. trilocularis]|uniref:Uncharacterized protein n=1 Tax=Brassica rapa subsp. trilocularis TaxID=1813537 RepID=A0ABQ7LHV5_BRACM|nr:hypothetical protein IGI04_037035 [Brassica rapa subsp. trilocularis]